MYHTAEYWQDTSYRKLNINTTFWAIFLISSFSSPNPRALLIKSESKMPITHIIATNDRDNHREPRTQCPHAKVICDEKCDYDQEHLTLTPTGLKAAQPILIDTDAGIDDAWALMLMAEAHKSANTPINIEAITCVHGSTSVDNVVRNVGRVLSVSGVSEIPIYKGCETAFAISYNDGSQINGSDGFGDAGLPKAPMPKVSSEHAVNAIVKLAEVHNGNLTILALGPLTNLAMAVRMQPKIRSLVKEVFVLGGNVEGCGNATVCGEFNFVADVESAHVVLSSFECPIYLVPWETCVKYGMSSYSWRLKTLGTIQTQQMKLLNAIERKILDKFRDGWMASDAIAAAVLLDPRIIRTQEAYHCSVELHGTHSRGMLVVDRHFKHQKRPNVMIITKIDLQLLQKMLVWAVGGPCYL